jgi:hypothetical protein
MKVNVLTRDSLGLHARNATQWPYRKHRHNPGRLMAKMLTNDEARRIASNIAKLPVLVSQARA